MIDKKIFIEVEEYSGDIITKQEDVDIIVCCKTGRIEILKKCSIQALYSRICVLWKEADLIRYEFPIHMLTPTLGEMVGGWKIVNPDLISFSIAHIDAGLIKSNEKWKWSA